ncbi:MAG: hypothetical protein QMD05_10140, partial [Candidatus Brocadiaceae bacterium]|nr:hypothetical protein [Candidatus Brocadiaceae bacterium]
GQYGSNPYKEDYVPSGRYLAEDGQFGRFEEKIFDNVTSNILSPQQLEERRRQRKADKLQQRYLEEQIAQMERYNSSPPYYPPVTGGDYPAPTENPVVNPLPNQLPTEIGTPVAVDATIMQMTEEQLLNMTWEQVFNSMGGVIPTPIP